MIDYFPRSKLFSTFLLRTANRFGWWTFHECLSIFFLLLHQAVSWKRKPNQFAKLKVKKKTIARVSIFMTRALCCEVFFSEVISCGFGLVCVHCLDEVCYKKQSGFVGHREIRNLWEHKQLASNETSVFKMILSIRVPAFGGLSLYVANSARELFVRTSIFLLPASFNSNNNYSSSAKKKVS